MRENDRVHYDSLDGLRGLAFMIVLTSHLFEVHGFGIIGIGHQGVWILFVLSAFLISEYFLQKPQRARSLQEWGNYALRRFLRIFPLFLIALLAYYFAGIINLQELVGSLRFSYAYDQLWTIPVQLASYIVIPFLLLIPIFVLPKRTIPTILIIASMAIIVVILIPANTNSGTSINILYYLQVFFYGIIASLINNRLKRTKIEGRTPYLFEIIGICSLFLGVVATPIVWSHLFYYVPEGYFAKQSALLGLLWAIFLVCLVNSHLLKRAFANTLLRKIGKISYSGYLFHVLIINTVITYVSSRDIIFIPLSIIFTIAVASVTYLLIEKPLSKIKVKDILNRYDALKHRIPHS